MHWQKQLLSCLWRITREEKRAVNLWEVRRDTSARARPTAINKLAAATVNKSWANRLAERERERERWGGRGAEELWSFFPQTEGPREKEPGSTARGQQIIAHGKSCPPFHRRRTHELRDRKEPSSHLIRRADGGQVDREKAHVEWHICSVGPKRPKLWSRFKSHPSSGQLWNASDSKNRALSLRRTYYTWHQTHALPCIMLSFHPFSDTAEKTS